MLIIAAASLLAMAMQQVVHPETLTVQAPVQPATIPPRPTLPAPNPVTVRPDGARVRNGLVPADYAYTMPAGVTAKDVVYYSDGVGCYAKIFYPPGFDPNKRPGVPAVVLGQGQAGTHFSIEKYGARFAEKGLVAMVIDYRGWGFSDGYARLVTPRVGGDFNRDLTRFEIVTAPVIIKRTRLLDSHQQEDYRNAISYIQGEPGVDPERIGIWGSSRAGGNAISVAGRDARVKVISVQIPSIPGPLDPPPAQLRGPALQDAIQRARTGQGAEVPTGFSRSYAIDREGSENYAMYYAQKIGARPFQAVVAGNEQLFNNDTNGKRAHDLAQGPKNYVVVPGIGHFDMYVDQPFEISANAAADWFVRHLNAPEAGAAPAARVRGGAPAPAGGAGPGRGG